MPSYIGHYKLPIWMMIVGPLLVAASLWFTWAVSQDAQYADMLAHPGGPYRWVMALPRPVLLGLGGLSSLGFAFGWIMMALSAMQRKVAFTLDAIGVRSSNMMTGKTSSLAWDAITGFQRVKSIRMLSGQGPDGRNVTVTLSMLGHDKRAVFDVITHYRPDMAPYLD